MLLEALLSITFAVSNQYHPITTIFFTLDTIELESAGVSEDN